MTEALPKMLTQVSSSNYGCDKLVLSRANFPPGRIRKLANFFWIWLKALKKNQRSLRIQEIISFLWEHPEDRIKGVSHILQ